MSGLEHILAVIEANGAELWLRTGQHIMLTGISTLVAIAIGIPLGVFAVKHAWAERPLLAGIGILQTVPSLAMLALLLTMLQQIGALPAIIALTLYALLPIVRNTVAGLRGTAPEILEAARGVGMTGAQQLRLVELPLALPVIVAGLRTAAVVGVGIATLSAFIGAGGLGQFINRGLALSNTDLILLGAIPSALLALAVDGSIAAFQWGIETRRRVREPAKIWVARLATVLPALILLVGAVAYWSTAGGTVRQAASPDARGDRGTVRIGAKNFTEGLLLSEMIAQLLEAKTDLKIERRFGLGGTMIAHNALREGAIDLYVEYTGTALTTILREPSMSDPEAVYNKVSAAYAKKFDLVWLKPFRINNAYVLAVRQAAARKRGWTKISDLTPEAESLRAGFTPEFSQRPDGYPGLAAAYGLKFGRVYDLEAALMYRALAQGEVDVISAYATDGRIEALHLVLLDDDRRFFPPYFAAPVVSQAALARHPEIRTIIAPLAEVLDNETMRALNWSVDGEKKNPREVAAEFLRAKGLLPDAPQTTLQGAP
jgi:glycine betaine/choline ABC-type transport system substrate-binding protein/ABC-type proline/glycine betaine transport system permease subunit